MIGPQFETPIATCEVNSTKDGWEHCKIAEGHTLDEVITTVMLNVMQMSERHEAEMTGVRNSLTNIHALLAADPHGPLTVPAESVSEFKNGPGWWIYYDERTGHFVCSVGGKRAHCAITRTKDGWLVQPPKLQGRKIEKAPAPVKE